MPPWCLTVKLQQGLAGKACHCFNMQQMWQPIVPGRVLPSMRAHPAPEASLRFHLIPISCLARATSQAPAEEATNIFFHSCQLPACRGHD